MNLLTVKPEKLEEFPKSEKLGRGGNWYCDRDFPWYRAQKFVRSYVGKPWAVLASDWVRAQWIPVRFRTISKLKEIIETHTFLKGKDVYYFMDRYAWGQMGVEIKVGARTCYRSDGTLYVHPQTKRIAFEKTPKPIKKKVAPDFYILGPYHQIRNINGIWYELAAICLTERDKKYIKPEEPLRDPYMSYTYRTPKPKEHEYDDYYKINYHSVAVVRHQLSSKKLKRYGLVNDKS
jgi:hypothetical protein